MKIENYGHFPFYILNFQLKSQPAATAAAGFLELSLNFLHGEALEDVAFLDVVVLGDGHAALVAGGDFLGSVLEALQGADLALMDDDVVAQHTDLAVPGDLAVLDPDLFIIESAV